MPRAARSDTRGFVSSRDGARIAYVRQGSGAPLVRAAHWLSHLEFDWHGPVWHNFLERLTSVATLVRYDQRGTGLSDREVADVSFESLVDDLEALVDALDLPRFTLLGMSQGGAISIAYAVRHPERVQGLVLCGAYARGHAHPDRPAQQRQEADLLLELIRVGWGTADPKFRHVFANMFIPDATDELVAAFDQLQRVSASPEMAFRLRTTFGAIDVQDLCRRVEAPTLVMHVINDGVVPFAEGTHLASLIPDARFVPLAGDSHILLPGRSAFRRFFEELTAFLNAVDRRGMHPDQTGAPLSARERQVMALVVTGKSNDEIASSLGISPRTVERHLSNVYVKLGVEGKGARAAAAASLARTGAV